MRACYGWVIVAAGGLMGCVAVGAMFSLAVFLDPMSQETGWSRASISSAMTLNFLTMGVGGFAWGAASDRFGPRVVVLSGAALLGLALVLASRAATPPQFLLTYGILVGLSASAFFAPMIATVTGWFEANRGLAISLVSAGIGVAPMTISPLASWLVSAYDWRTAMLSIGILAWVLLLPAGLLVRRAPAAATAGAAGSSGRTRRPSAFEALQTTQFLVLGLTFFACCAAHSGPIFHMISYATLCGISPFAAVSIYSVEGLAGLSGRLLLGMLADRYGAKRILIAGLLLQALAIPAYLVVDEIGEFYALAVIFGIAYGGVMPLYAMLARSYFGQEVMGTVFGAATMLSSIGMAFGPLAGGWAFDRFGDYSWLYIGSFMLALGAVAIALTFPRVPAASQERLQPA